METHNSQCFEVLLPWEGTGEGTYDITNWRRQMSRWRNAARPRFGPARKPSRSGVMTAQSLALGTPSIYCESINIFHTSFQHRRMHVDFHLVCCKESDHPHREYSRRRPWRPPCNDGHRDRLPPECLQA